MVSHLREVASLSQGHINKQAICFHTLSHFRPVHVFGLGEETENQKKTVWIGFKCSSQFSCLAVLLLAFFLRDHFPSADSCAIHVSFKILFISVLSRRYPKHWVTQTIAGKHPAGLYLRDNQVSLLLFSVAGLTEFSTSALFLPLWNS